MCVWPYVPSGAICTFPGFLEFSSKYYTVLKSAGTFEMVVNRIGPATDVVNVSYRVVPIQSTYFGLADFGYFSDSLSFAAGVISMPITVTVYNSFIDKAYTNNFYVILYNPIGALIYNANLSTILDYSWSDKGISVVSYSILEIWDDPAQAISTLTQFTQAYPATISTQQAYTMSFTAYNTLNSLVTTSVFVIEVRNITDNSPQVNCLFHTNNFFAASTIVGNYKATPSSQNYEFTYSNSRGMYLMKIFLALPGAYAKIYTNTFFSAAAEEGIRSGIGVYNQFTRPLGNSSAEWSFSYFPNEDIYAVISATGSTGDYISIYIDEVLQIECYSECSSDYLDFILGTGYWFRVRYVHYTNSNPGFTLELQDGALVYDFSEIYAHNYTGKYAQLYIVDTDEC